MKFGKYPLQIPEENKLVDGFIHFYVSSLYSLKLGEMIQVDSYFSDGQLNHQLGSQYCSSSRFLDGYSKLVDGLVESFTSAGGTVKTGAKAPVQ